MKKFFILGSLCLGLLTQALGQDGGEKKDKPISGTVINSADNQPVVGATVVVKGTMLGTLTDIDGKFKITVPAANNTIVISYVGMKSQEFEVGTKTSFDVKLEEDVVGLDEVVVTALGISREKKSLGYASQQIDGEAVAETKSGNFVNQISGKVAGVQVKTNNNMGGSTNIVIRGYSSLTGNNQALFIVDGIPMNNDNSNASKYAPGLRTQAEGLPGYDYGNAVADINPNDIESINVLKGAAATALYGSRAANGVVIITTKKGKQGTGKQRLGVDLSSNVTLGFVDKKTFPKYQNKYGQGYGPYYYNDTTGLYNNDFIWADLDGDGNLDPITALTEDASYGAEFDENLMVYQWDAFIPESPNYHKKTPWKAADNGPITFFETSVSTANNVSITGGSDKGSFRVSYQKLDQKGIMPGGELHRNNFGFNGALTLTDKFSVTATGNYINTRAKGRNVTGYNANLVSGWRQWYALNVDMMDLKELYELTDRNVTWNPNDFEDDPVPIYWNNPYYQRYHNYETDERNRFYGNVALNYQLSEAFWIQARISADNFAEIQEERLSVGSNPTLFGVSRNVSPSGYSRYNKTFLETNFDLMGFYEKDLSENLNFKGTIGSNVRRTRTNSIFASTEGGLVIANLYSLDNSFDRASIESDQAIGINGFFANASFGLKRLIFLDIAGRVDKSSTLPVDKNTYFYPSAALSFIFSEKLKQDWLDFGKVRLNYAQVGNDAPFGSLQDIYSKPSSHFGTTPLFSVNHTKRNSELRPEISSSIETGLEMIFLKNKFGFDVAYYNTKTKDQIFPVAVSAATGYTTQYVNAGTVQNSGIELSLNANPYKSDNFKWDIGINWGQNRSKVLELFTDASGNEVTNLQLGSFQGGITINATKGEAYGTIQGTDFEYINGKKVVKTNGKYKATSTTDNVLGNINPDWNMGITNSFKYKNLKLSALVDWQKGGDVFSLDLYYGLATGLYEETVYNNDLGNPVRNSQADGGGEIFDGVNELGETNTIRADGENFSMFGYAANPNAAFVYDASYVKLREVVLSYSIPSAKLKDKFIGGATFSIVGNNLWIIHKNLPHADPEAGVSSGNLQGWQSGVLPTTRNIGFNVSLNF
ncbi:MAG: SusC/RagA family TonB-linked outer membrane protein [Flavobacteriales bacterium]|nr:SusC/RagA family TonB-linked outer membrane protein [Flavobacteriales bacterium]